MRPCCCLSLAVSANACETKGCASGADRGRGHVEEARRWLHHGIFPWPWQGVGTRQRNGFVRWRSSSHTDAMDCGSPSPVSGGETWGGAAVRASTVHTVVGRWSWTATRCTTQVLHSSQRAQQIRDPPCTRAPTQHCSLIHRLRTPAHHLFRAGLSSVVAANPRA
jgi:hypothetical protein